MGGDKVYAIEPKVLNKIKKTCFGQRELMDYVLVNHYSGFTIIDDYSKSLVCEMHAMNSKIIETIETFFLEAPEIEREETKKKELILLDTQILILETALLARSELSTLLLRRANISTHCH